jgi:secreted PhoX family phosphatase
VGHVATGTNKGKSYILGKFNKATDGNTDSVTGWGGWENLVANPTAQDKTIVVGLSDGGTASTPHINSVGVYIGTKTNTGTEVDRAGLTNGVFKFVSVTGNAAEITNSTTRATGITSGTTFTLSTSASTTFSRPEDGAWNPLNPNQFYFVTTDQLDRVADGIGVQVGRTRLWRLNFTDITDPDLGGTIDLLATGGVGNDANMWDNLTVNDAGRLILQEDVGNAPHNGKVWFYDPATATLTKVLKHDAARFGDVVAGASVAAGGSDGSV